MKRQLLLALAALSLGLVPSVNAQDGDGDATTGGKEGCSGCEYEFSSHTVFAVPGITVSIEAGTPNGDETDYDPDGECAQVTPCGATERPCDAVIDFAYASTVPNVILRSCIPGLTPPHWLCDESQHVIDFAYQWRAPFDCGSTFINIKGLGNDTVGFTTVAYEVNCFKCE